MLVDPLPLTAQYWEPVECTGNQIADQNETLICVGVCPNALLCVRGVVSRPLNSQPTGISMGCAVAVERTRGGPGGQRRRGCGEVLTAKDLCQLSLITRPSSIER
jgi:hypothetical protein